jgi:hypothetical protein
MGDSKLTQLNSMLQKLKRDRDCLLNDTLKDRQTANAMESELNSLKLEADYLASSINEKEEVILEYDRLINESQKTVEMIEEKTDKLLKALVAEEKILNGNR